MEKIYLLAGFFILTSTSPSFAKLTPQDTLPDTRQQYCKLCNMDLRLNFIRWMQAQTGDSLANITVNLRPRNLIGKDNNSAFNFNWWPQAIQLNNKLSKVADQNKTDSFLAGFAPEIYKWFGLHR